MLHDLILHEVSDLLFLLETKLPMKKLEAIRRHVGLHGCVGVDSVGRGGGLALMWRDTIETHLINFSQFHIHAWVNQLAKPPWLFIGIYSHLETAKRFETWHLLGSIKPRDGVP